MRKGKEDWFMISGDGCDRDCTMTISFVELVGEKVYRLQKKMSYSELQHERFHVLDSLGGDDIEEMAYNRKNARLIWKDFVNRGYTIYE